MEGETGPMRFEEVNRWLDEVADSLPDELFRELNGGVVLLPGTLPSKNSEEGDLYTLGMYHNEPRGLGRYITLYYGSFVRVYGHATRQRQKEELDRVLRHELTHHIESLAGVRDLEVKDRAFLEDYRRRKGGTKKETPE